MSDLPLALRALNRACSVVPLHRALAVDPERTLRRAAGTRDVPAELAEAFAVLVGAVREQPCLTPFGHLFVSQIVRQRLANRFAVDDAASDLELRPIERPVFIVSLPRTGTTLLHRLLALDPAFRVLQTWEMDHPVPAPDPATYADDPRIRAAERDARVFDWVSPRFKSIHEVGARLPEECINLFANDLRSVWFLVGVDLPAYARWLYDSDLHHLYARHALQLQLLQSRFPARRWLLKAPMHLLGLQALLDTHPDAVIVQTFRDPVRVVASEASLFTTMRQAFHDRVDPHVVGSEILDQLSLWASRATTARRAANPERFVDVLYDDLVGAPMTTIDALYRRLGMELDPAVRAQMQRWLQGHRQHAHGPHGYAPEDFGLVPGEVRERFAAHAVLFGR